MEKKFEKINVDRLRKMLKSDELLEQSLMLLLKNLRNDVTKIKICLEKNQYDKISELCHKIKLSVNLISLDSIEEEINKLGLKNTKLDEKQFIVYTQKIIYEIESILK